MSDVRSNQAKTSTSKGSGRVFSDQDMLGGENLFGGDDRDVGVDTQRPAVLLGQVLRRRFKVEGGRQPQGTIQAAVAEQRRGPVRVVGVRHLAGR